MRNQKVKNRSSPIIEQYRAIIFDLFHTLTSVESANAPGRGTIEILGVSRREWNDQLLLYSRDRLSGKIKDPFDIMQKMARAINPDISERLIKDAIKNRIVRFKYSLCNIPVENITTLKQLKNQDKLLGLISNADVTERYGWFDSPLAQYFDSAIFSCDVGYVKPDKEIYERCLKELHVLPQESIFVGDGGSDELKGAKVVGMTTILVTQMVKDIWPERIIAAKKYADYEINYIRELLYL